MIVVIRGQHIEIENEGSFKSGPVTMAILEAFSEQNACTFLERTRAWKLISTGKASSLKPALMKDKGVFRLVKGAGLSVNFNSIPLTKKTAMSEISKRSYKREVHIGAQVLNDCAGWTLVLHHLLALTVDLKRIPEGNDEMAEIGAKSVLKVIQWLKKRKITGEETALDHSAEKMIAEANLGFLLDYVRELALFSTLRQSSAMSGQVYRRTAPTSISPTLLAIKSEIDAFHKMRSLRSGRLSAEQKIEFGKAALHNFASALAHAAIAQRLGQAVSASANLASSFLELHLKDMLAQDFAPINYNDRIELAFSWLKNAWEAAYCLGATGERQLVRRCVLASIRRVLSKVTNLKVLDKKLQIMVSKTGTIGDLAEKVKNSIEVLPFNLSSNQEDIKEIEFGDLVEAWKLALYQPKFAEALPSPFGHTFQTSQPWKSKIDQLQKIYNSLYQAHNKKDHPVLSSIADAILQLLKFAGDNADCMIAAHFRAGTIHDRN